MKKIMVIALVACMGLVMTSCDSDSLNTWLPIVAQVLSGITGKGQTSATSFTGTANLTMYDFDSTKNTYDTSTAQKINGTVNATLTVYSDSVATVTLDNIGVSGTAVTNYSFTTYCYDNKIDPQGPNYLTGGTCTLNGTANTSVAASAMQGTYSTSQLNLTTVYIQVGSKLIMGTYTGKAVTTEE